jgi:hypothetical protein
MGIDARHRPVYGQRVVVALALLAIFAAAGAVYYGGTLVERRAPPYRPEPIAVTPTLHPPRGRRWYFERPLWEPPTQP